MDDYIKAILIKENLFFLLFNTFQSREAVSIIPTIPDI